MYTLITYLLAYTLVIEHWVTGFIMMTMPFAMLGCLVITIMWLFIRPARIILPIIVLLIGYPFIRRTIAFNKSIDSSQSFSVLSYNVYGFYNGEYEQNKQKADALMTYSTDYEADIKCFQEFFNVGQRFNGFPNPLKDISKKNPYYVTNSKDENDGFIALVIFSKYPIIHHQSVQFGGYNSNGYVVADIARKHDTIRVINIQLQSMGIRVAKVVNEVKVKDYQEAKKESRDILSLLKKGFIQHTEEIKPIEKLIDESPYPVIICGDFNEMPYGSAYGHIRDRLKNAFEEAGQGFGFTLNRSPRFVRIDNQFCSEAIQVTDFKTHHHITLSDHYPIVGRYQLTK